METSYSRGNAGRRSRNSGAQSRSAFLHRRTISRRTRKRRHRMPGARMQSPPRRRYSPRRRKRRHGSPRRRRPTRHPRNRSQLCFRSGVPTLVDPSSVARDSTPRCNRTRGAAAPRMRRRRTGSLCSLALLRGSRSTGRVVGVAAFPRFGYRSTQRPSSSFGACVCRASACTCRTGRRRSSERRGLVCAQRVDPPPAQFEQRECPPAFLRTPADTGVRRPLVLVSRPAGHRDRVRRGLARD